MSEDNSPRGRSTSRALEQASSPVRVCPLVKQEGYKYYQACSAKVPDPAKLSNSNSLTYNYQQVQIISKFKVNANYFANENTYICYIFNATNRDAQRYLYARYKPNTTNPFKIATKIINYLGKHFINPYYIRKAKRKYKKIYINET